MFSMIVWLLSDHQPIFTVFDAAEVAQNFYYQRQMYGFVVYRNYLGKNMYLGS